MLLSREVERIEKGEPVCLNAIAEAWAERRIKAGHASYLEVHSLASQLSNELQLAVRCGQLHVFDTFRKRERPYREKDEADLASGRVWLSVLSVDEWLLREGLLPALAMTERPNKPHAVEKATRQLLVSQSSPLFWNPLPEAAAWLAGELGMSLDERALTDLVVKKGKPGTPDATVIKAVLRKGVNCAQVALSGHPHIESLEMTPFHRQMTNTFGPLPNRMAYVKRVFPTVAPLCVNQLIELLVYGETQVLEVRDAARIDADDVGRFDEMVFLLPWGMPHMATLETCGLNRADLEALRDSMQPRAQSTEVQESLSARGRSWFEVSSPYIAEVLRTEQLVTAKALFRTLEEKAGPSSPFDRGTGSSRGSLYLREIGKTVSLKTIQNRWQDIRALLRK